ncbi:MAG: pilus assembly FimT family protein [Prochlorotrichaceae cyanobacterium]|jgi:prepilin-type N-terminal cleavage/methylation domain-containing protein
MFSYTLKHLKRSLTAEMKHTEGFTLLEVLVVAFIVGILSAIAAPSWLGYMSSQRAKDANERSFAAIRLAQSQAIQTRKSYRASFREDLVNGEERVQYSVHAATLNYGSTGLLWETLPEFSLLDTTDTTLTYSTVSGTNFYYVEFDFQGNVTPPFGKIVYEARAGSNKQSCTIISTLIGGMRIASDSECD